MHQGSDDAFLKMAVTGDQLALLLPEAWGDNVSQK
jgi:hypothetical protein